MASMRKASVEYTLAQLDFAKLAHRAKCAVGLGLICDAHRLRDHCTRSGPLAERLQIQRESD
jgi:hypothetical protein